MAASPRILQINRQSPSFIQYLRQTLFSKDFPTLTSNMQVAPAAERNKEPILNVLKTVLPSEPIQVLEVASGTGQHVSHFAQTLTHVQWQPSDIVEESLKSIQSYIDNYNLTNVKSPVCLDVLKPLSEWPSSLSTPGSFDAILCTNMIHITPWKCTEGLFSAAGSLLKSKALLITYGPYSVNNTISPESNVRFDIGLRQQNPEWGIRDIQDLSQLALKNGLELIKTFDMPANNKILVFQKQ